MPQEAGGGASSEGAAPPILFQPSSFIYRPRVAMDAYAWGVSGSKIDAEADHLRRVALTRRLSHAHGAKVALDIATDSDHATNADLRAWRKLGRGPHVVEAGA
jgi:hypothetical protein